MAEKVFCKWEHCEEKRKRRSRPAALHGARLHKLLALVALALLRRSRVSALLLELLWLMMLLLIISSIHIISRQVSHLIFSVLTHPSSVARLISD